MIAINILMLQIRINSIELYCGEVIYIHNIKFKKK